MDETCQARLKPENVSVSHGNCRQAVQFLLVLGVITAVERSVELGY